MGLTRNIPIIVFFILWVVPLNIFAQAGPTSSHASDTIKNSSKGSLHSLFSGVGYGSNMIYLGSTMSHDQPYGYGNLTYGFKDKIYASFSGVHLSGFDPFISFYIGALNFSHNVNSWFDVAVGAYRYQIPSSLADTLFSSFTYSDLTLGFDWKLLYSKLTIGGLLSEENQIYFQFRNSRYFQTPEFFKGKADISFDPYANLLFGTLVEVKTFTETSVVVSSPGRKWKKYTSPGTTTNTSYLKKFGIMEVEFGLPVALNTDMFTIEAEIDYVLPLHHDAINTGAKGLVFMLSGYFRIF